MASASPARAASRPMAQGSLADIDAPAALRANAIFVATDVKKRETTEALVKRAVAEFGRLDIMLNNAGVAGIMAQLPPAKPLAQT